MRLSLLLLSLLLTACGGSAPILADPLPEPTYTPGVPTVAPGQPFELAFGHTVQITDNDLQITFLQVLQDSRCPTNVACVWAGQVQVQLSIGSTIAEFYQEVVLVGGELTDGDTHQTPLGEWTLTLLEVAPYPGDTTPTTPDNYILTLILEE